MTLRSRIERLERGDEPARDDGSCRGLSAFMREQVARQADGRPLLPISLAPAAYRRVNAVLRARAARDAGLDLI